LAAGRNIGILRQEFVEEKESQAFAKARRIWEKDGLTTWDFGDLPLQISLTGKGPSTAVAFPALAVTETGIGIRLFHSESEAGCAHRKGLRALLVLRFRDELKHLRKGIAPTDDLRLWAAAYGGGKILENALIDKVLHDLFETDVRTGSDFDALGERVRPQILPRGQAVLRMAGPPLKALFDTTELLRSLEGANRGNGPVLSFLAELRDEISRLLPTDFLTRFEEDRLTHIGRYLRALAIRAERGAHHLEKVLERSREIRDITDWHSQSLRDLPPYASEEKRQALAEFVWMIEEYKVSLFAQELKTAFPVSRKRIETRMADIQRML
jgi:ATP-dependent helicase HrpA